MVELGAEEAAGEAVARVGVEGRVDEEFGVGPFVGVEFVDYLVGEGGGVEGGGVQEGEGRGGGEATDYEEEGGVGGVDCC